MEPQPIPQQSAERPDQVEILYRRLQLHKSSSRKSGFPALPPFPLAHMLFLLLGDIPRTLEVVI